MHNFDTNETLFCEKFHQLGVKCNIVTQPITSTGSVLKETTGTIGKIFYGPDALPTTPQSNLRRVRRSSADKTSRIANYWDRTALAIQNESSRVERFGSTRLGVCVVCVYVCFAAAKMTAGRQLFSCYRPIAMLRLFCYVFAHEFLFNPHLDLEPDYIIRKPIFHRIQRCNLSREILSTFHTRVDSHTSRSSISTPFLHSIHPQTAPSPSTINTKS